MALILQVFNGSTWDEFDQDANFFCLPVIRRSYSHPTEFTFRLHVPQHTRPIPDRALVALEDTDYSGHPNRPVFMGHVYEIVPKDSNIVEYTCYGPDMRARNEITIMSDVHTDANAIPRLVYNAKIDNDDDYAFEYAHDADVGTMLANIFENAYPELIEMHAAPLTGGAEGYVSADMTPLDFIPQEKVVFESEKFGQGIDRLLNYYPAYRLLFTFGYTSTTNVWRVIKATESSTTTLTLNEPVGDGTVLSLNLRRSMEQRCTAFKIYGPRSWRIGTLYSRDLSSTSYDESSFSESASSSYTGLLVEEWDTAEAENFETEGPTAPFLAIGYAGRKWSIGESARSSISRVLPEDVYIADSQFNVDGTSLQYRAVRQPTLQATWDNDGANWWTVPGIKVNIRDGIIETPTAIYQYDGSDYILPKSVRLIYAYFYEPVSVRAPTSGFEGTAYDDAGMEYEEKFYDEMLSVGYEQGTPIVIDDRMEQYQKLAQQYLDAKKDIVYTGGCTLQGIVYDYLDLNKRINFAALDGDGEELVTGWEEIGAILTDVEYDYQNKLTTLTFSSDLMDFANTNVDQLRALLKIRALEIVKEFRFTLNATATGEISQVIDIIRYLVDPEANGGQGGVVGQV